MSKTRSSARADELRSRGVEPVLVDVFDAPALTRAIVKLEPDAPVWVADRNTKANLFAPLTPDPLAKPFIATMKLDIRERRL